jgi:hypothetical protein
MDPSVKALIDQMIASQEAAEKRAYESDARLARALDALAVARVAVVQPVVSLHKELSERMEKFAYNAEENSTFELWYGRYESIFTTAAATLSDAQKVDLLTEKLSYQDYLKFANTILPQTKATIPLDDAVKELKRIFGRKESQFALRYRCLKIEMEAGEDFDSYAARVNLKCEKFDITKCSADDFKVLMFVQGLNKAQHSLTLEKLLAKLDDQEKHLEAAVATETVTKLKLQDVVNIASRIGYLKEEKSMVLSQVTPAVDVMAVYQKPGTNRCSFNANRSSCDDNRSNHEITRDSGGESKPPSPCYMCGSMHFVRDCSFKSHQCFSCKETGHKDGYCKSAASWNKRRSRDFNPRRSLAVAAASCQTRKFVEMVIDKQKVKLQLDSGSDWTIISRSNWNVIGSPALTRCRKKIVSASGDPIKMLGEFAAKMKLQDRENVCTCYVASSNLNLLGSDCMEAFNMWNSPLASFTVGTSRWRQLPVASEPQPMSASSRISRCVASLEGKNVVIADAPAGSMVNVKNKNAPSPSSDMVNAKQSFKGAPGANGGKATVKNENVPRNSNVFNTTAIRCVDEEDVAVKMIQHKCDAKRKKMLTCSVSSAEEHDHNYDVHEEVVLWMNTVGPHHNRQKTYTFFSLPFCVGSKQSISHYHVGKERDKKFYINTHKRFDIGYNGKNIIEVNLTNKHEQLLHVVAHLSFTYEVFWRGVDVQIESDENCATNAKAPIECMLEVWRKKPVSRINIDYGEPVTNRFYLVIKNVFCSCLEAFKMTSTAPATSIKRIKTAPHHPQATGLAECFVTLLMTALKKLQVEAAADRVLRSSSFQVMTRRVMRKCIDQLFKSHHRAKWKHFGISHRVASQKHFSSDRRQIKKRWYIIDNNNSLLDDCNFASERISRLSRVEPESVAQQYKEEDNDDGRPRKFKRWHISRINFIMWTRFFFQGGRSVESPADALL